VKKGVDKGRERVEATKVWPAKALRKKRNLIPEVWSSKKAQREVRRREKMHGKN